jgi:hypothetical protein
VAEEVEELLSRQRMQRLRESLAFRSLGPCSSCVLEVPEGDLGVHGGVLFVLCSGADLILLGVGLWRRKVFVEWWMCDGWMEWLWM